MPFKPLITLCLALSLVTAAHTAHAGPTAHDSDLYKTVKALDAQLFGANITCDLKTLDALVDDKLEFYHDKGGLMQGKAAFLDATKNNICHKVERQLIENTLEVYPLENYGAIELGEHTFCNKIETPVCKDETNGIGKFFMLWQKTGDGWKLTRVISYDHLNDWERKPRPAAK